MGLLFFPRGGSAHVARSLARALPATGWEVTIAAGSLSLPGHHGDAREFYAGCDVRPFDMTDALGAEDPMLAARPLHPSYEDRPGAQDRVMAALGPEVLEHQAGAWAAALRAAGAAGADVLHLHHLTPINEAAGRVAPDVPVVAHIHGTELLMLEHVEEDPGAWPHAGLWVSRMREWAARARRIVVLSATQVPRAERLLGVDPARCVQVPNGFDPALFHPRPGMDRIAHWRRHLVTAPQGWRPGAPQAGSVAYRQEDLEALAPGNPVLLYVGRFTAVKRLGVLLEAYAAARAAFTARSPLVILGGFPGEWEGEHPADAVDRLGLDDVFLAGWHGHDELPGFCNAADVVVLPSVREQFGQVLVEGMACGLPAIAVNAHGPAEIVRDGGTGWLVPPDDVRSLRDALVEAVNRPDERARRGRAAREDAEARFSWPALAARMARVYHEAAAPAPVTREIR